jgi:hypothetical protein
MARVYVPVDVHIIERAGVGVEKPGHLKVVDGLKRVRAWCDENTPGWHKSPRCSKFRFESRAHADQFREAFRDAFAIHPGTPTRQ